MASIYINKNFDIDSAKRTYNLKYQIGLGYINGKLETIDEVNILSNADWCVVDADSITNYQADLLIEENLSLEEDRQATVTVEVSSNTGIFTAQTTITQSKFEINAIWKNKIIQIETQTNALSYYIKHNEQIIYAGKAYVLPSTNYVEIDISKICSNYLNSTFENTIDTKATFNKINGVGTFELYVNNAFYGAYMFYNDYSYNTTTPNIVFNDDIYITLSDPIKKEYDARQYVCYSFFNATESEEYNVQYQFRKRGGGITQTSEATLNGRQEYVVFRKIPSNCISFRILNDYYTISNTCNKYCLYYLNAYGGWDSLLIDGNDKRTDKITSYKYLKSSNNNKNEFGVKKYLNVITPSITLFTSYLNDEEASKMHHLLESTEVYLHNLEEDEITPVNITNSNCEYKTFSNNGKKKFYYQIDVEVSQHRIRM